ncbi:hypothetical protein [Sphaerimonospora mesophila]|uniref:hypothetical protein n=1 Tax=Sphaerimonospora mesophila TaxID=37483 RepID=UPI000783CAF2
MSRSVDIDFVFDRPVRVPVALEAMLAHGVSFSRNGVVSHLLDEDGMYDWQEVPDSRLADVINSMGEARWRDATLGIVAFLDDFPHGGDVIFHPDRLLISFVVSINKISLPGNSRFCDMGWYLRKLVPIFEPLGLSEIKTADLV